MEHLNNILFLDIETVPEHLSFTDLSERKQSLFDQKFKKQAERLELDIEAFYAQKAGIFAEFSKIICISVGYYNGSEFRTKSFFGEDEKLVLKEFSELLDKHYFLSHHQLCAHNGKEFDFPVICRRLLINKMELPQILKIQGKKPWEIPHLDTLEMWKFGDWKNYTSLDLLCEILDVPTPKSEITGKDVAKVYYEEKNIEKIVQYCERDVEALALVYRRMS